jgi:hypothetical protein
MTGMVEGRKHIRIPENQWEAYQRIRVSDTDWESNSWRIMECPADGGAKPGEMWEGPFEPTLSRAGFPSPDCQGLEAFPTCSKKVNALQMVEW